MFNVRKQKWGADTLNDEGKGRRVVVENFDKRVTINDFINVFGPADKIEGITLLDRQAYIQFKRPKDLADAIARNGIVHMLNHSRPLKIKACSSPENKSQPGGKASNYRIKKISEQRREQSRSRSRSPTSTYGTCYNQDRQQDLSLFPNQLNSSPSVYFAPSYQQNFPPPQFYNGLQNPSNPMVIPNLPVFQQGPSNMTPFSMIIQRSVPSAIPPGSGDLSGDVEFYLKNVIEKKTARHLSLFQIEDILKFFQHSKELVSQSLSKEMEQQRQKANQPPPPPVESTETRQEDRPDNEIPDELLEYVKLLEAGNCHD